MFLCYYVAWPCDLDFWPFDLESLSCTVLFVSDPHTNFLLSHDYRLLSCEYWISDHISVIWNSHCACAVSRDLKNSPHFWNPWPQFSYLLCHFHGATTKIKPCYRQKISVFPLWRLQSLLHMHSITWPVYSRSPKTTRNNFLTPNCLFTIQLVCGYHDD